MTSPNAAALAPWCLALLLLAPSCSDEPEQQTGADSGPTAVECTGGEDCVAGDCIANVCVWCTDATCPAGSWCSYNGKCLPCDGGCAGELADAGGEPAGGDAGASCVSRGDCAGLACRAGRCGPQDPSGACATADECVAGNVCVGALCVAGCTGNADCAGSAAGPRCDVAAGTCGPCADGADCAATENCLQGRCVLAAECPNDDRGPCGNLVCVAKVCRPCVDASECGPGFDCKIGRCEPRASCSIDEDCHNLSASHWCDTSSGMCNWGCLAAGACSPDNCCPPRTVCNTVSRACENAPCNNCGGTCLPTQVCDTATCTCVEPALDGGILSKCSASCGCPAGLTCQCGIPCTVPQCIAGLGLCTP